MKCVICGERTLNKRKNIPTCKSHIVEAMASRDEHNAKVRENLGNEYMSVPRITSYVKDDPMLDRIRTTTSFHLNKMIAERKDK